MKTFCGECGKGLETSLFLSALRMIADWNIVFDARDWSWIVAHLEHLLRMDEGQVETFKDLLNEDRSMTSVIDLFEARGKVLGKAEGEARLLIYMVKKGRMNLDEARSELRQMAADGLMDTEELELALQILVSGF